MVRCIKLIEKYTDICYNTDSEDVLCQNLMQFKMSGITKTTLKKSYQKRLLESYLPQSVILVPNKKANVTLKKLIHQFKRKNKDSDFTYLDTLASSVLILDNKEIPQNISIVAIEDIPKKYNKDDGTKTFKVRVKLSNTIGPKRYAIRFIGEIVEVNADDELVSLLHIDSIEFRKDLDYRDVKENTYMDIIDNRVAKVLELFEPVDSTLIKKAFELRLKQMQITDVFVDDVEVDMDGNITVEFSDGGEDIDIMFTLDPEEGAIAIIEPDEDEDDFLTVDLSHFNVPIIKTPFGDYLDLLNLGWLNKTILRSMLSALEVEHTENGHLPFREELNELTKIVVRDGKKIRKSLVRRKRKKRLTSAQRMGIRKGAVKRKAKMNQTNRKRKKSMLLRKRSKLKTGNQKGMKVQGTK